MEFPSHERNIQCPFHLSNAPSARCGSACSKTWRCVACDHIRSTIIYPIRRTEITALLHPGADQYLSGFFADGGLKHGWIRLLGEPCADSSLSALARRMSTQQALALPSPAPSNS